MGERWMMFVSLWQSLLGRECLVRSGDSSSNSDSKLRRRGTPAYLTLSLKVLAAGFTWNKDIHSITCYCSH